MALPLYLLLASSAARWAAAAGNCTSGSLDPEAALASPCLAQRTAYSCCGLACAVCDQGETCGSGLCHWAEPSSAPRSQGEGGSDWTLVGYAVACALAWDVCWTSAALLYYRFSSARGKAAAEAVGTEATPDSLPNAASPPTPSAESTTPRPTLLRRRRCGGGIATIVIFSAQIAAGYLCFRFVLLHEDLSVRAVKGICTNWDEMQENLCVLSIGNLAAGIVSLGPFAVGIVSIGPASASLLLGIGQASLGLGLTPYGVLAIGSYVRTAVFGFGLWECTFAGLAVSALRPVLSTFQHKVPELPVVTIFRRCGCDSAKAEFF